MTGKQMSAEQQAEAEAAFAVLRGVPDVGDTFKHTDRWGHVSSYRVESWLRRRPPRKPNDGPDEQTRLDEQILSELRAEGKIPPPRGAGPDDVPLEWFRREEAEYISGYGVCGIILRVADVVVTGRVPWTEEVIEEHRRLALLLAGEALT
jgi:hypothetical protein